MPEVRKVVKRRNLPAAIHKVGVVFFGGVRVVKDKLAQV